MFRSASLLSLALLIPVVAEAAAGVGDLDSMEKFARTIGMESGGWQTRVTLTAVEFKPSPAALPADVSTTRAQFESRLGKVTERRECLAPGSDRAIQLPGIVIDPTCAFSRIQANGGRWTLDSTCRDPVARESADLRGEGTYSPTLVTGRHEGGASFKGVTVHLKAEFESRHVGECEPASPIRLVPAPRKD